jgi:hypothetical protein
MRQGYVISVGRLEGGGGTACNKQSTGVIQLILVLKKRYTGVDACSVWV